MNWSRLAFRLLLGRRAPITRGSITLSAIEAPVSIRRDRWAVPFIEAQTDVDAWYALGFCHGQDRAFQLEALLRVARGTLAEVIGPDGLPIDRLSRRIGFVRAAERQRELLVPAIQEGLAAYAAGITDGATRGMGRPAHEYALLRSKPSPWTAVDVLAVGKLQSFVLATNWDVELARLKILTEDGPEALADLDPAYPEWQPVASPPGAPAGPAVDRLAEDLAAFSGAVRIGGGSNNWALAGSRTRSGRPLLANDPHLSPVLPSHWYLCHLRTPGWSLAGASFAGIPGMLVGHNGFCAWGITVGMIDNTDLFIEELGPDGRSVLQGDTVVPCEVRLEEISVKGAEPVREEVLITPRGPIVGPTLEGEVGVISLRAVWLDDVPIEGLFRLHRVRSFEEFRQAFAEWPAISLNMAYADQSGGIGWQLVGRAPIRRKGHGAVPMQGRDPEADWEGAVPFDELPHLVDPGSGFVATANTKPVSDGTGPFLGVDWIDGYRLARIVEELESHTDWDFEETRALQLDVQSIPWREMREIVLAAPAASPETEQGLALLHAWDGRVTGESPAAAVFEEFVAEMTRRVAAARAPRSAEYAIGLGFSPLAPGTAFAARRVGHLVRLLREQPAGWFERSWEEEIGSALGAAVRRLRETRGSDSGSWSWGRVRPLTLQHPMGVRKPLDRVFNRGPLSCGGDPNTVAQASVDPRLPAANPGFIASLRMILDVGNWEENLFCLPGGQSGNPCSPHYDDQLPLWLTGDGFRIAWSEEEIARRTVETLELLPAPNINPR